MKTWMDLNEIFKMLNYLIFWVDFLEWEGLKGRGLMGDLEPVLMTWMNLNGLEWTWMGLNELWWVSMTFKAIFIEWLWMGCNEIANGSHHKSFKPIQVHWSSFRFIQVIEICSKSPVKPLPLSPSHSRNWTIMITKEKFHSGSTS